MICHDAHMGPLDGVKVVDLSVMISGPLTGMMLADQGADVVKVESPGLGDMMRFLGSQKGGITGIFANNNRGKRSLVVDLKQPAGLEVLQKLVADADVLIQNFRPGAMERLGLGYDDLSAINPDLIYVSISGYGPDGPNSHRRVYDNVIQAASGLASVQTDPATGSPSLFRTLLCDKVTSYTATQAVTAALYARATGKARGQHIVLAMLDAAIAFMWPDSAMDAVLLDDDVSRTPTIGSMYSVTMLNDGFAAASAVSQPEFAGLCAALGVPEVADDPRFANPILRSQNGPALVQLMREAAERTTVEQFLAGAGLEGELAARSAHRRPGGAQRGVRRARAPVGRPPARTPPGAPLLAHPRPGGQPCAALRRAQRRDRHRAGPRRRRPARRRHHRLTPPESPPPTRVPARHPSRSPPPEGCLRTRGANNPRRQPRRSPVVCWASDCCSSRGPISLAIRCSPASTGA
jgi:crotonobetainyl-CoA:carnitine CoA-transferase CaiB-like acyl-CoA transferase